MKLLSIALVGVLVSVLVIANNNPGSKTPDGKRPISKIERLSNSLRPTAHRLKTSIDGKLTPDKISDRVGYSVLFGIVADRTNEVDQKRARAFLKRIELDESQIDQLIAVAQEFRARANPLEIEGDGIKRRNHPNHLPLTKEDKATLKELQKQRDDLTDQIAESLEYRLGKDGAAKVKRFIKDQMKRKIKIME
jgi:hypothetical protein